VGEHKVRPYLTRSLVLHRLQDSQRVPAHTGRAESEKEEKTPDVFSAGSWRDSVGPLPRLRGGACAGICHAQPWQLGPASMSAAHEAPGTLDEGRLLCEAPGRGGAWRPDTPLPM
jgi:hypothetical protein